MTQDTQTRKLPGERLLKFAEKYFEKPGLEKIALPVIADLQHEYSSRPAQSKPRFLILLRSYLSFWKTIGMYSLSSNEGNIRPFKSIRFVMLLGAAVGIIFSLISWRGNQTTGLVSTFPDMYSMLAFFVSLCLAIAFCVRQLPGHRFADIWKVAHRLYVIIGVILATTLTFIGIRQFKPAPDSVFPDLIFLGLGFLFSMFIVLVFSLIASLLVRGMYALGKRKIVGT